MNGVIYDEQTMDVNCCTYIYAGRRDFCGYQCRACKGRFSVRNSRMAFDSRYFGFGADGCAHHRLCRRFSVDETEEGAQGAQKRRTGKKIGS